MSIARSTPAQKPRGCARTTFIAFGDALGGWEPSIVSVFLLPLGHAVCLSVVSNRSLPPQPASIGVEYPFTLAGADLVAHFRISKTAWLP
jgi:hypothetical protein